MKCIKCSAEMVERPARFANKLGGRTVTVRMHALVCPSCGSKGLDIGRMADYGRLVADSYRKEEALLTSVEIRHARERLKLSQQAFADYLGVGVASVKRWEWGKVQERSMDKLLRLMTSLEEAEEHVRQLRERLAVVSHTADGEAPGTEQTQIGITGGRTRTITFEED